MEEAEGGVYPTTAVNKETMSETMPRGAQGDTMAESKAAETLPPATQSAKETATQPAKETATQPASQETEAAVSGDPRVHVVQEGETLYGICIAEYQTMNKMKEICELNGLDDENKIVAGQKLLLP